MQICPPESDCWKAADFLIQNGQREFEILPSFLDAMKPMYSMAFYIFGSVLFFFYSDSIVWISNANPNLLKSQRKEKH